MKVKPVVYHVPCTIFRDYLKVDALRRERILSDVLFHAMYREWLRLDKITDEEKRFDAACANIGMNKPCMKITDAIERGKELWNAGINEACFSIGGDLLRKHMDKHEEQTDEERALFVAYLALGSILGNKEYTKTNILMWLSRMDGSTQVKKPFRANCATFTPPVEKYYTSIDKNGNRKKSFYKTRRLRALLYEYYGVSSYADGVRGFYFSLTMDMEELVKAVKEKKSDSALSKFNEAKKKALESSTHDCIHDCNHMLNRDCNHDCNLKCITLKNR